MNRFRPAVEVLSNQEVRLRLVHTSAITSGGSKGGGTRDASGVQILLISCSFWENLTKSYVGDPLEGWHLHFGEILDPPLNKICNKLCNQTVSFRISLICFVVSNH